MFGKDKMTTFERLYVADKETHVEKKNLYYEQRDNVEMSYKILKEFGLIRRRAISSMAIRLSKKRSARIR